MLMTLPTAKEGVYAFFILLLLHILPLRILSVSNLNECIELEVNIANRICRFIHLYGYPSQTQDKFEVFKPNLELNLDSLCSCNPFLTVLIGNFNGKSKQWCTINQTSLEGSLIEFLSSQFGLLQIIQEPTHILENSRSCMDLLFTSQSLWSTRFSTCPLTPLNSL